jgi:hypothetical protein
MRRIPSVALDQLYDARPHQSRKGRTTTFRLLAWSEDGSAAALPELRAELLHVALTKRKCDRRRPASECASDFFKCHVSGTQIGEIPCAPDSGNLGDRVWQLIDSEWLPCDAHSAESTLIDSIPKFVRCLPTGSAVST